MPVWREGARQTTFEKYQVSIIFQAFHQERIKVATMTRIIGLNEPEQMTVFRSIIDGSVETSQTTLSRNKFTFRNTQDWSLLASVLRGEYKGARNSGIRWGSIDDAVLLMLGLKKGELKPSWSEIATILDTLSVKQAMEIFERSGKDLTKTLLYAEHDIDLFLVGALSN